MSSRPTDTAGGPLAAAVTAPARTAVHSRSDRARHLKLELSRALRLERAAAGITQSEVGVRQQLAACWEQADEPHAPTVLNVATMPAHARPVAVAAVRFQADHLGIQLLERARVLHGNNHVVRLSVVTSECTDPARALSAALADGHLDDDELEAIRLESRQAAEAALELDAWAVEELLRRRAVR